MFRILPETGPICLQEQALHRAGLWRKVWDSNPRGREPKRFSRPPRYDRFDNFPYRRTLLEIKSPHNDLLWEKITTKITTAKRNFVIYLAVIQKSHSFIEHQ